VTEDNRLLVCNNLQPGRCVQTFYGKIKLPYSGYLPSKFSHKSTRLYGVIFHKISMIDWWNFYWLKDFFTNCAKCRTTRNDQFQLDSSVHVNYMLYKTLLPTSHRTHSVSIMKISPLTLFREKSLFIARIVRNTQLRGVAKDVNF